MHAVVPPLHLGTTPGNPELQRSLPRISGPTDDINAQSHGLSNTEGQMFNKSKTPDAI